MTRPTPTERAEVATVYEIPLRTISAANAREHWAAKHRRVKRERAAAIVVRPHPLPCVVRLVRVVGPRGKMLDVGDNLPMSCKGLRDGIADRLGVDDADPRVRWEYAQERGAAWAVRVEIRPFVR